MTQYVHPEFGVLCPTPRLRRWLQVLFAGVAVGAIGLGFWATGHSPNPDSALAVAVVDDGSSGMSAGPIGDIAAWSGPARGVQTTNAQIAGPQAAADKPSCPGDTWAYVDGKCVPGKPRKPRMVRVPTNRPAIAAIAIGRSPAPIAVINDPDPATTRASRQSDAPQSTLTATADATAAAPAEPTPRAAPSRNKKKTAHNRRRDPYDGWRVADWYGRGYAPRDYYRGGYGGSRNFW